MLSLIFFIISILSFGSVIVFYACGNSVLHKRTLKRSNTIKIVEPVKSPGKGYPLKRAHSNISEHLLNTFASIPEVHRPSYDINAALVALDEKYRIVDLDSHFSRRAGRHSGGYWFSYRCPCLSGCNLMWDRIDGDRVRHSHEDYCLKDFKFCVLYPEFHQMIDAINEINAALDKQQAREAAREREIVLAGIENDLKSVEDITNALKNERNLIDAVTKEI